MLEIIIIAVFVPLFVRVTTEPNEVLSYYGRLIFRLPDWLYKPLGGCPKCMAGQIGFWAYLFTSDYIATHHILAVTIPVVAVYYLTLIIERNG